MKTIEEIMSFEPQLTTPEFGTEPTLKRALKNYYTSFGIPSKKADMLVTQYIEALKEFAK